MEKVDPIDMARAHAFESDLRAAEAAVIAKVDAFQLFVDGLFAKHGMTKGRDRLGADGTIVRDSASEAT